MSSQVKGFEPKNITVGDETCLFLHVLRISIVSIATCYELDGPWFNRQLG